MVRIYVILDCVLFCLTISRLGSIIEKILKRNL